MRRILFALATVIAAGAAAQAASAPLPPPTLTGEDLNATSLSANVTCTDITHGSATFSTSGDATGPYPGTFTESGSFSFAFQAASGFHGTFHASFTIVSGDAQIVGTKDFDSGIGGEIPGCSGNQAGFILSITPAFYSATITTPHAAYHDEGTTPLGFETARSIFNEGSFVSTLTETTPIVVAPGNSPLDQNGNGCGDTNHIHLGGSNCKK